MRISGQPSPRGMEIEKYDQNHKDGSDEEEELRKHCWFVHVKGLNLCTFCAIPKMRGKHASKRMGAVLEEARRREAFDANTLSEVEAFLNDPRAWQAARS